MKYLLDTNICINLLRGGRTVAEKMDAVGFCNCFISEITKAELLVGASLSRSGGRQEGLQKFLNAIDIIPISEVLPRYAAEKVRLMKCGKPLEDFDLLIGCTAVEYGLTMVTDNTSHLGRLGGITIEDWIRV